MNQQNNVIFNKSVLNKESIFYNLGLCNLPLTSLNNQILKDNVILIFNKNNNFKYKYGDQKYDHIKSIKINSDDIECQVDIEKINEYMLTKMNNYAKCIIEKSDFYTLKCHEWEVAGLQSDSCLDILFPDAYTEEGVINIPKDNNYFENNSCEEKITYWKDPYGNDLVDNKFFFRPRRLLMDVIQNNLTNISRFNLINNIFTSIDYTFNKKSRDVKYNNKVYNELYVNNVCIVDI